MEDFELDIVEHGKCKNYPFVLEVKRFTDEVSLIKTKGLRITFTNGFLLSLVVVFSDDKTSYMNFSEIAILKDGRFHPELFSKNGMDGTLKIDGTEELLYYINKVGTYKEPWKVRLKRWLTKLKKK